MSIKDLKALIIMVIICMTAVLLSTTAVYADMSSKPSLIISPNSFPSNSYVAVLSTEDELGYNIWHVDDTWFDQSDDRWIASKAAEEINWKFYEYVKDNYEKDGWYLWGNIATCQSVLAFKAVRPSRFRILVYLADEDIFIVTEEYSCSAFDYTVNIRYQNGELITDGTYNTDSISRILLRMGLTVAIELIVCLFFLKNKDSRNLLTVIAVNLLTQLILHVLMYTLFSSFFTSAKMYYPLLIILEIIIIFAEGYIYAGRISRQDMSHPYYYSVIANILSFVTGLFMTL